MRIHRFFGVPGLTLAALALFGLAAGNAQTTVTRETKTTTVTTTSTASGTIDVKLSEYRIDMPTTIAAGPTTFKVANLGKHDHSFKIKGKGLERELAKKLDEGQSAELTVDLKPGTYTVTCPVGSHDDHGMKLTLVVTPAVTQVPIPAPAVVAATEIARTEQTVTTVTMTGCLRKAADDPDMYVLEGATRTVTAVTETPPAELARSLTSYTLLAISGVNFKDHVGHKVEVTGTIMEPTSVRRTTTTTPTATQTTTTSLSRFQVSSIRMLSESCR